ncbi:MAG: Holliday junction branch migration protein RuvA [Caldisericota bacterium]|nr:Holliday junction branch migration protein RuvA [Caldisericota bacterium]
MIALLKGNIYEINGHNLIVLVNGIGFEVVLPRIGNFDVGNDISLYIYEDVKDDGTTLYGFTEMSEKELFGLIIRKVGGIGAKTALEIFKRFSREQFISLVETGDFKKFQTVPGIGGKTAKRVVIELGGEIKDLLEQKVPLNENLQIAKNALISVGYSATDAVKVLKTIDENDSVENIVKMAIKKLSNE